jgi:hypothetical protein
MRQVCEAVTLEQRAGSFAVAGMHQDDPGAGAFDLRSQPSQIGEALAAEGAAQVAQAHHQLWPAARQLSRSDASWLLHLLPDADPISRSSEPPQPISPDDRRTFL